MCVSVREFVCVRASAAHVAVLISQGQMDKVTECYSSYYNVTIHTETHNYRTQWSSAVRYQSTLAKTLAL